MIRSRQIYLPVVALLGAALACTLPGIPTPDPNALLGTMVAQTIMAGVTQTAQQSIPVTGLGSPTPTLAPTLTPTETLSPTPIFTPTPLVPQISVSVPTNCRVGPGKIYDRVGALLVGEVAEVFGRDPTGNYWYIRNPDSNAGFCWLWGEYATLAGNFTILPVYTPPPTPTPVPAFEASYAGKDTCVGWWVDIKLENTGGISFRSVSLTLRDLATDIVLFVNTNGFTDISGCLDSSTKDVINPGDTRRISSPAFAYDPAGHEIRATITLCSNAGVSGTCVSRTIKFTP